MALHGCMTGFETRIKNAESLHYLYKCSVALIRAFDLLLDGEMDFSPELLRR